MLPEVRDFLDRSSAILDAVNLAELQDKLPAQANAAHNLRAQILRNGCVILAFATLEDFLKRRAHSALSRIATGPVAFGQLPEKLREAATIGVARAFATALGGWRNLGRDQAAEVQQACGAVASTTGHAYEFTPLIFGHTRSNISEGDITALLSSVNATGGWAAIGEVASRAGVYSLPAAIKPDFENFCRARHVAAHNASALTQPNDLRNYIRLSGGIAFAVDCLVSVATARLHAANVDYLTGKKLTVASDVKLRLVAMRTDGRWDERGEKQTRASKIHADQAAAVAGAVGRAKKLDECVVVTGSQQLPIDWYSP